jgi:hypothetical protein
MWGLGKRPQFSGTVPLNAPRIQFFNLLSDFRKLFAAILVHDSDPLIKKGAANWAAPYLQPADL